MKVSIPIQLDFMEVSTDETHEEPSWSEADFIEDDEDFDLGEFAHQLSDAEIVASSNEPIGGISEDSCGTNVDPEDNSNSTDVYESDLDSTEYSDDELGGKGDSTETEENLEDSTEAETEENLDESWGSEEDLEDDLDNEEELTEDDWDDEEELEDSTEPEDNLNEYRGSEDLEDSIENTQEKSDIEDWNDEEEIIEDDWDNEEELEDEEDLEDSLSNGENIRGISEENTNEDNTETLQEQSEAKDCGNEEEIIEDGLYNEVDLEYTSYNIEDSEENPETVKEESEEALESDGFLENTEDWHSEPDLKYSKELEQNYSSEDTAEYIEDSDIKTECTNSPEEQWGTYNLEIDDDEIRPTDKTETSTNITDSTEKEEEKEEEIIEVPKDIRSFLRKYPSNNDISVVKKYFTQTEIDKALKLGKVYKRGTKLRI